MKKITKGALATGLGVALLLGGGGTLAVWNDSQATQPGSIVSGDLALSAGTGVWKNAQGTTVDVSTYKVVPGDKLTFTQPVTVTLVGDQLQATLAVTGMAGSGFAANNVAVQPVQLKTADGQAVSATLTAADNGKTYTASTTFEFLSSTSGRDDVNTTHDFTDVSYTLTQTLAAAPGA